MPAGQDPGQMSIGQLGHHPGLHVSVNLEGKTIGGERFDAEHWVPGAVVGASALGNAVTIELETPIGGGEPRGLFHREAKGQKTVSIDDPSRVRAMTLEEAQPGGVPEEIAALARAGKSIEAIKRYRALNGATLAEARAAIAQLDDS